MIQTTFAIIKPDAVQARHVGEIIARIEHAGALRYGFTIEELEIHHTQPFDAVNLYREHEGKFFYGDLISFITSGLSVLLAISGDDVIARWRKLMGATDANKAEAGTIRHAFGSREVMYRNCVHGSDSPEAAKRELELFFGEQA